jgi:hypothetical protein
LGCVGTEQAVGTERWVRASTARTGAGFLDVFGCVGTEQACISGRAVHRRWVRARILVNVAAGAHGVQGPRPLSVTGWLVGWAAVWFGARLVDVFGQAGVGGRAGVAVRHGSRDPGAGAHQRWDWGRAPGQVMARVGIVGDISGWLVVGLNVLPVVWGRGRPRLGAVPRVMVSGMACGMGRARRRLRAASALGSIAASWARGLRRGQRYGMGGSCGGFGETNNELLVWAGATVCRDGRPQAGGAGRVDGVGARASAGEWVQR